MKSTSLKSAKRFGTRYGKSLKQKVAHFEGMQRSLHKCPSCKKIAAKRITAGIFVCKSCSAKFASKAYTVN